MKVYKLLDKQFFEDILNGQCDLKTILFRILTDDPEWGEKERIELRNKYTSYEEAQ